MQEGPVGTLHPKASLKPKTGEVVVGSSPTLTDEFIDTAVEESRMYAISKGAEYKGMAVNPYTFKVTCGIILLSGYNRLPSEKMYSPDSLDRVQEGLVRTLHPKASLKPKNGEVVVGSSPTLDSLDTFGPLDNLFTSMGLLKWLSSKEIGGTGTVRSNRSNRVIAMPHPDPKTMEKEERGSSMTYYTEDTEDCVGTAWKDNKSVYVASNVHSIGDGDKHFIQGIPSRYGCRIWAHCSASTSLDRVQEGPVGTLHPKASLKPNTGEVVVGSSPTLQHSLKWTWSLSLMLVNSWHLWHNVKKDEKDKMSLLTFLRQVVTELLTKHGEQRMRTG